MEAKTYIFRDVRRPIRLNAIISGTNGSYITKARTVDLSASGAKLQLDKEVTLPLQFQISLSEKGGVQRVCEVVWRSATTVGVRFIDMKQLKTMRVRATCVTAAD